MSDIFDHELDAWEDYENRDNDYEDFHHNKFTYDPLFYHIKYSYTKILNETPLALCLLIDQVTVWVPKSLCRQHRRNANTIWIYREFEIPDV